MGRIARTANSTSRRGFVKIAIAEVGAAYLAGNTSRAWVSEEKPPRRDTCENRRGARAAQGRRRRYEILRHQRQPRRRRFKRPRLLQRRSRPGQLANPASAMLAVDALVDSALNHAVDGQSRTVLGFAGYAHRPI